MDSPAPKASRIGVILGGGAVQDRDTGAISFHFAAMSLDRTRPSPIMIPLTFLAHGVTPSPNEPDLLLLFEKHGPGCCALDLRAREVRHVITTSPNRQFYGHGAFSPDGSLLYSTETDLQDDMKGYITVRDGKSFAYLGDFPTHGVAPHDCMLRDNGKTLVITNGGSPLGVETDRPCVTHVDVATGKLLENEPIPAPHLNAGHLAMTTDGGLVVVSAPRHGLPASELGGISMRPAGGKLVTASEPADMVARMRGETLSAAIHEPSGVVAATNTLGQVVTFWKLATGEFLKVLRVPKPRGVALTLSGDEMLITYGLEARVSRIAVESLTPVDAPGNVRGYPCAISGSHVCVRDTEAA